MSAESTYPESAALLRLQVVAEADPGALARILHHFQSLNVVPRRVIAESAGPDLLQIEVDLADLDESRLAVITAKIGTAPYVLDACWRRL